MTTELSPAQEARAAGVLLGQACGDALGVPYELGSAPLGERAEMVGGGLGHYAPGEWSDDTQMALCVAEVAATGADLTSAAALDEIADRFLAWYAAGPSDVGAQTARVLTHSAGHPGTPSQRLRAAAAEVHAATGRSAGNGALMRTAVVGLTRLADRGATAAAARAVAGLTHADPLAGDACVLWSEAVRLAVVDGRIDVVAGLDLVPAERRAQWEAWVEAARSSEPGVFSPNGFTVTALQAALSAIQGRLARRGRAHLEPALQDAVRVGDDTDTVAAVAGTLLGAAYGPPAVPLEWQRIVHGWPGARAEHDYRARDLVRLAVDTARGGRRDGVWPDVERLGPAGPRAGPQAPPVPHPADPEVLLGTVADLTRTRELGVTAVVSLCRLGRNEVPAPGVAPEDHTEVWLTGSDDPSDNPYAADALEEAAGMVARLRGEGKRVLVHGVGMTRRTPAVAARYGILTGDDGLTAGRRVRAALPAAPGRGWLWRLATGDRRPPFSSNTRAGCTDGRLARGDTPPAARRSAPRARRARPAARGPRPGRDGAQVDGPPRGRGAPPVALVDRRRDLPGPPRRDPRGCQGRRAVGRAGPERPSRLTRRRAGWVRRNAARRPVARDPAAGRMDRLGTSALGDGEPARVHLGQLSPRRCSDATGLPLGAPRTGAEAPAGWPVPHSD